MGKCTIYGITENPENGNTVLKFSYPGHPNGDGRFWYEVDAKVLKCLKEGSKSSYKMDHNEYIMRYSSYQNGMPVYRTKSNPKGQLSCQSWAKGYDPDTGKNKCTNKNCSFRHAWDANVMHIKEHYDMLFEKYGEDWKNELKHNPCPEATKEPPAGYDDLLSQFNKGK